MSSLVSIIVPIYSVEKYICRCLDSLLQQSYENYELILIDDGSPDRCSDIIDEYAKQNTRIVAIHQANHGVSAARNAGLAVAKGIYISFVDPDDFVERDFLKYLVNAIENTNADIACCNWDTCDEKGVFTRHDARVTHGVMNRNEWIAHLFDIPRTIGGSNCNKLFRRECIQIRYDEQLTICEDRMFFIQNSLCIEKAVYIDSALYHIYIRPDSTTRADDRKLVRGLLVEQSIFELVKNEGKTIRNKAEADLMDTSLRIIMQFKDKAPEIAEQAQSILKEHLRSNFISIIVNNEINWKEKILFIKYI